MTETAPTDCKALLKEYCAYSSLAGLRFIADDSKHWIERLFWLIMVILSWCGSILLILSSWDAFQGNPISFGVETTYTDWDTKMGSLVICETSNNPALYKVSDELWTPDHLIDLEDVLKDVAFFRGTCTSLVDICYRPKNPDANCITGNYMSYANMVRSSCKQLLRNCTYNGNSFDCCTLFQPLDTDVGRCFAINSLQTADPKFIEVSRKKNHGHSVLTMTVHSPSLVYTLAEDEVPTLTTLQSSTLNIKMGMNYSRLYTVRNIENDPLVVDTTQEQRSCRFNWENEGGLFPKYSFSACTLLCRKNTEKKLCNCSSHFMPGTVEEERCNITGMACLHVHSKDLVTLKPKWAQREGLICDCVPSCNETEHSVIKDISRPTKNKMMSFVEIKLAYLPSERFKRSVVRGRLDLVVSLGGTTGLFLGASLLSFVEIFFYFTIRFISNHWMKRNGDWNRRNNVKLVQIMNIHSDPNIQKKRIHKYTPYNNELNRKRNELPFIL